MSVVATNTLNNIANKSRRLSNEARAALEKVRALEWNLSQAKVSLGEAGFFKKRVLISKIKNILQFLINFLF